MPPPPGDLLICAQYSEAELDRGKCRVHQSRNPEAATGLLARTITERALAALDICLAWALSEAHH